MYQVLLVSFLFFLTLLSNQAYAFLQKADDVSTNPVVIKSAQTLHTSKSTGKQFIVQFKEMPVVAYRQDMNRQNKRLKSVMTAQQKLQKVSAHSNRIIDRHFDFERRLRLAHPSARVTKRFSTLLNAVVVEGDARPEELKSLADAKGVFPVKRYKTKLSNALPVIRADDVWQLLGGRESAGQNIKIAVIDSGILPEHPMFDDANMSPPNSSDLPNDDYCRTQDASFCNNKLIVARHYLPSFVDLSAQGEYDSPLALSGHGVHVAGIATGRQVTADNGDVISGVAPGAYLMAYKALWGQDGEGTDIELYQAMEDAYKDGADVINNSWGGESGGSPSNSVYQSIYQLLENEGVVIVTAVGNEGEDDEGNRVENSVACPACVEAGLAVGATTTDLVYGLPIQFDQTTLYAQPSDNYSVNASISGEAVVAPASNSLGCTAWEANSLSGKIAVVNRGTCFFEEKANFAQDAGAVGLVVINNVIEANITMAMGDATLPSLLLSKSDGQRLTDYLQVNPDTELTLAVNLVVASDAARQDVIAPFSSLGPNGDASFIKPDISAPGVAILSATGREDFSSLNEDFVRLNGSSMAAPMVAGAAALVKQNNPSLSAKQIKNVLINSSDATVRNEFEERDATPFETGAGRVNVLSAINAKAYAEKANMANTFCLLTCSFNNTLISLADTSETWTASVTFDNPEITAQVTPSEISLNNINQSVNFNVEISVPRGTETDWHFGRLVWTSGSGESVNQAIAISNEQQESELLQTTLSSEQNGQRQLTLLTTNVSDSELVDIDLQLVGGAEFESQALEISTSGTFSIDTENSQNIEVSAQLEQGDAFLSNDRSPIEIDLADEGVTPISCDLEGCDEVLYEFDFDFVHYGIAYSQLMLSDNGLILAGNTFPEGAELYFNRPLPSNSIPNNIIAPFWIDFDLINTSESNDTGGGFLMVASYVVDGETYLVLQWQEVQLYVGDGASLADLGVSSADLKYSFQVILQQNSENKWFRYLDIPEQPNEYSVGIENSTGTQGYTYWHNSSGVSAVNSGDSLGLSVSNVGQLTLTTNIVKTSQEAFTTDDEYQVVSGVDAELNVLSNDLVSSEEAILISKVNDVEQLQTVFSGQDNIAIDTESLTLTTPPEHGVATLLASGLIRYLANNDFAGQDTLTYQVSNTAGQTSSADVTITVIEANFTNNPLVVEIVGDNRITSNETKTYSVNVTSSHSDLSYRWILPSELAASSTNMATIDVTAAQVVQSTVIDLSVEVTSGEASQTEVIELTIAPLDSEPPSPVAEEDDDDKGLLGLAMNRYLLLLLFGLLVIRRKANRL